MPQLHLYVPDDVAATVKARAKAKGASVSAYLAEVVKRDAGQGWPRGFFEEVVGGWKGKPLDRPPQGRFERRGRFGTRRHESVRVGSRGSGGGSPPHDRGARIHFGRRV